MLWWSHGRGAAVPAFVLTRVARQAATLLAAPMLWCASDVVAGAEAAPPLHLADVLVIAQDANPAIRVMREQAIALRAVPAQVSAYDDPTLSWEAWNAPESLRIDQADNNIFRVTQKVPFPGKRTLAGIVAEHAADGADQDVRVAQLDVAAAVKRAYADLWLAYQKRDIAQRDKALVERITHTTEQKYGVGTATQAEALRAQVELTHMVIDTDTAALAIDTAAAELNALLSRPPDSPLGLPDDPPMRPLTASVDSLTDLALRQRPELAAQRAAIAREQGGVELAGLNWRPDFEFSVGRFINYGHNDGFGAIASVTVPFVYASKYTAGAAEAHAKLESAQDELRGWQDRIRREVAQAYLRARTATLQHDLAVSTHLGQSEQALRVTESAYQSGSADFVSLLDTVRTIEAVHVEHVQAAADLARATADLERAVGGELPPSGTAH